MSDHSATLNRPNAVLPPSVNLLAHTRQLLPGLALVGALAVLSVEMGRIAWFNAHGISALTLAIVLGIVAGNTFYPRMAHVSAPGVTLAKQKLLRLGIILYGFRLTFQDIGQVGVTAIAIDAFMLTSTFVLAWVVGTRVLGLGARTAILIGAGSSICGAAAVMATEPVVRGRSEEVTVAVATVVVFGTLAMFLYPAFYQMNAHFHWLTVTANTFGIYAGSTIHEVAQVLAAGRAISEDAANTAVITKMVRVAMLAPFLFILSYVLSRRRNTHPSGQHAQKTSRSSITIPWFALAFLVIAALHSVIRLPAPLIATTLDLDTLLLAMAMAGLGLGTHARAMREAGIKPLALASLLFAWLVGGGLLINLWFAA